MIVRFRKLSPTAVEPTYATDGSAGLDLYVLLPSWEILDPGESRLFRTGIAVEIPPGFEGQIRPRSGLASKQWVTVLNSPGTLDSDFRGEIQVLLVNHGASIFRVDPGMRIAQLVISPVVRATLVEVEALDETVRGAGGFGSSGQ